MGTDGSTPMALDYLQSMRPGNLAPLHPKRIVVALDHYGSSSGAKAQALQERARSYARTHGVRLFEEAEGISHQLILESGAALPGLLLVGADSHTTSYGALNAFATGIGSSDLASVLLCGKIWLKVPETLKVVLHGRLRTSVSAKDVALWLARRYGADGATYRALEFTGSGVGGLDMDDRIVLANMSVELGAKAGIFPFDDVTYDWLAGRAEMIYEPVHADAGAIYAGTLEVDLDKVVQQIALPHRVDNVVDASNLPFTPIDMVYLGTCTGGRVKDYEEALVELRRGGGIAKGVRVVVTPASETVRSTLELNGMLEEFVALGATIQPPGCGSCCGTSGALPGKGERVVSTANRNFKGRMGNAEASIYLASPRACAIAATRGGIGGDSGEGH